ncbi:hypothetical protein B0H19DRAFT_1093489 [Mycena capillaripes]|nr:hypothetical protein B0H19DRAFT_1093489 [Mycena capillaripes]
MAGPHRAFLQYSLVVSDSPQAPGFHPHLPGRGYTLLARGVGATMWFFIFYRLRQDGGKLLVCRQTLYSVLCVHSVL